VLKRSPASQRAFLAAEVLRVYPRHARRLVNFAAAGNPGWAPYDPDTRSTRVYTAEPISQPYPEERSRRIWFTHRFDTLDLLQSR
jgi:para-nitrobenzyl esterase